jgi:transposase
MAAPRRVIDVAFTEEELADLERVSRSRTEPASHVQRARILLTYRRTPSLHATGREVGVTHQTVERCLRRAQNFGVEASLKDSPRPGREPTITNEAKMFVLDLACRKAKDLGYPHEVWTTRLLARNVRERVPAVGHAFVAHLAQGRLVDRVGAERIDSDLQR